jgi:hypothetical protein
VLNIAGFWSPIPTRYFPSADVAATANPVTTVTATSRRLMSRIEPVRAILRRVSVFQ